MAKRKKSTPWVEIESLNHEARGVARVEGKTTFVFNALPQEKVQIEYDRCHSRYDEAHSIDITEQNAMRVEPRCPHFGVCGGCRLQHIDPDQQIALKQAQVLELFEHQAQIQPKQVLDPLRGPSWGYRHKARIGMRYIPKKEKLVIGFRERGGRYVTDSTQCHVLHPSVGEKITELQALINELSIRDHCPQFEVAVGEDHTGLILRHMKPLSDADKKQLIEFAKKYDFYLYLQPKGIDSIHLLRPEAADPLLHYGLPDYEINMAFHPADFTQVNFDLNRQMVARATELLELKKDDRVIDLFCGIGNFTLPFAHTAAHVAGVEGATTAIERAKLNAKTNKIDGVSFHVSNLFEPVEDFAWARESYNKVFLDPPRAGAKEILPHIIQWQPERIVYVSCNPDTLVRDSAVLAENGYTLDTLGVMDLFPHTEHVEAIACFTKNS